MKKTIAALLLTAMLFALASCGTDAKKTAAQTTASPASPPTTTVPPYTGSPAEAPTVGFDYYGSDISEYCVILPETYAAPTLLLDVTDAELDDYIAELLRWNPKEILLTDRAVAKGDVTYIYYTGYIDGVAFEGGSNADDEKPYALTIGSGAFIPGFEDAMIGMIPSETSKETPQPITVTFPENYGSKELADKEAVFEIYLVAISGGYEPRTELSAEFLTDVLGYKTEESDVIAAYRAEIKKQIKKDAEENAKARLCAGLIDHLRASAEKLICPETELARCRKLYTDTVNSYYEFYAAYGQVSSLDEMGCMYFGLGAGADWRAYLDELCIDITEEYLLIYAVAKNEGITVSDDEFRARLTELAASNQMTEDALIKDAGSDFIYNSVVFDKVVSLLSEKAAIDYGTLTPQSP